MDMLNTAKSVLAEFVRVIYAVHDINTFLISLFVCFLCFSIGLFVKMMIDV